MANKWYHDNKGNISAMRIMVLPAAWAGIAITIMGAIGVLCGVSDSIAMAGVGTTLFTISSGAKSISKTQETKKDEEVKSE